MTEQDLKKQADEIGIDVDSLISFYRLYIEQTDKDLQQLKALIPERRTDKVKDLAHSIKGASLNLDLNNISETARKIENYVMGNSWSEVVNLFEEINKEFSGIKSFFLQGK